MKCPSCGHGPVVPDSLCPACGDAIGMSWWSDDLDQHASFWRRVAGSLVDYVVTGVVSVAIAIGIFALLLPYVYTQTEMDSVLWVASLLPSTVFFAYRWIANSRGGTLGKRVVGVRVVRSGTNDDAGLRLGLIRVVVAIVSGLPLGLGYLWAAWDGEGKTWHDKAARTSAIRNSWRGSKPLLATSAVGALGLSIVVALTFVHVRDRIQFLRIEGASMEPTFHNHQSLTAVKHGQPGRGEVIAFRFPLDPSREFVKRVIGVPGDTVEVRGTKVLVNGKSLSEDYIKDTPNYAYGPKTVPPGMYFVLGDNRRNSFDSHAWGSSCSPQQICDFVPQENIIGQVLR
jgi:signal peptidase I